MAGGVANGDCVVGKGKAEESSPGKAGSCHLLVGCNRLEGG